MWLNSYLLSAALDAQANTEVPITICIQSTHIAFCREDGRTFVHWTFNLQPEFEPLMEPEQGQGPGEVNMPDTLPASSEPQAMQHSGAPEVTSVPDSLTGSPPAITELPPEEAPTNIPGDVQRLINDINMARPHAPPPLDMPTGTYKQRVVVLLRIYDQALRHSTRDRHKQLRLAYELGCLHHDRPQTFWNLLTKRYSQNRRNRTLRTVQRIAQIAATVNPGQLYDTMFLSVKQVNKLSSHMFRHQLLPNLE